MPYSVSLGLFEEPETRKPSKARLLLAALFLLVLILLVVFISLYAVERIKSNSKGSSSKERQSTTSTKTCNTPACAISAGDILSKLDQSTEPCDDFYQYSCGGFLEKSYIPDGQSSFDSFTEPGDAIQYTLRDIFQNNQLMSNYSGDPNSAVFKAFTFYKSCMSDASIETAGTQPIFDVIEKYGSCNIIKSNWSGDSWVLEKIIGRVFAHTSLPVFLNVDIEKSFFNTSEIFISISSGLSGYDDDKLNEEKPRSKEKDLPLHDKPSKKIPANDFEDYGKYISSIFKLCGTNSIVDNASKSIVKLEDNFLKIRKILDGDDADAVRNNVKFFTIDELNHLTSFKFNWTIYLEEVLRGTGKLVAPDQKLMIYLPNNLKKIVDWLADQPKSLLANEIIWRIIRKFIDSLPKGFRKAREKYYATFGVRPNPRWKACNDLTNQYFTHATTLLYVNKRVTEDALKKVRQSMAKQAL